jgi:4-amino-4-deoxy-L-arabinose transferase-like glycosyltransferase
MRARTVLLLLAAACALLFFGRLGATSLWDLDETSNARAAVEMMERGDAVVPTLNGELRTDKPPLHYWFMIAAFKAFGVNEFAARFFPALFATATVLLVGAAGCAWYGWAGGLAAGLALATSLLFSFSSRSATTDAFLVFFVTAAVLAGFAAREGRAFALLAWVAAGYAVLAKGPVGLLIPAGALFVTALLLGGTGFGKGRGGWKDSWLRSLLPPLGILLFLSLALPWYLLAAERTGGALVGGFLLKHNLGRFLSPMESHRGPLFYYVPVVLLGFFPWAALLPQAVAAALRRDRLEPVDLSAIAPSGAKAEGRGMGILAALRAADPRGVLLCVWAGLVVLLFSFSGTKLPTYILSAFPALALMVGALAAALARGEAVRGMAWSWGAAALAALCLPVGAWLGLARLAPGQEPWALWLGAGALLAALLPLWMTLKRRPPGWSSRLRPPLEPVFLAAAGAAILIVVLHQAVAPGLETVRTANSLGRAVRLAAAPGDRAASLGYYRPSLVFYAGRPVERLKTPGEARAFLDAPGGRFLFTTMERFERLPLDIKARLRPLLAGPDFPDSPQTVLVAVRGWGR